LGVERVAAVEGEVDCVVAVGAVGFERPELEGDGDGVGRHRRGSGDAVVRVVVMMRGRQKLARFEVFDSVRHTATSDYKGSGGTGSSETLSSDARRELGDKSK